MPYKLRKAPKRELYWVVAEDGSKKSKEPIPLARAKAQIKALYASMKGDGKVTRKHLRKLVKEQRALAPKVRTAARKLTDYMDANDLGPDDVPHDNKLRQRYEELYAEYERIGEEITKWQAIEHNDGDFIEEEEEEEEEDLEGGKKKKCKKCGLLRGGGNWKDLVGIMADRNIIPRQSVPLLRMALDQLSRTGQKGATGFASKKRVIEDAIGQINPLIANQPQNEIVQRIRGLRNIGELEDLMIELGDAVPRVPARGRAPFDPILAGDVLNMLF